jgi:transposase
VTSVASQGGTGPGAGHRSGPGREPEARDRGSWEALIAQLDQGPLEEGWVTLSEAESATGLSRSTLRSWYRRGEIPSSMVPGIHGPQRVVRLDAVVGRALQSHRGRRQLEHARSLDAEVASLRRRVEALERHLGLG